MDKCKGLSVFARSILANSFVGLQSSVNEQITQFSPSDNEVKLVTSPPSLESSLDGDDGPRNGE